MIVFYAALVNRRFWRGVPICCRFHLRLCCF